MKSEIESICKTLVKQSNDKFRCSIDEGVFYFISETEPYADRIFINFIDEIKVNEGTVTLISEKGTWFGDKEVVFSFKTGSASIIR